MSWIDRLKALAIISLSTIISFFIVEYSYRYIKYGDPKSDYKNRTMLFEVGNNFQNFNDYFKYSPNQKIRSVTLFSRVKSTSIDDLVIEYDYLIRTNNFGLVMKRDVFPKKRAIFVIGDSFTEGQGASPWFYDLEDAYDAAGTQLINLGILGTGPEQWENLASSTRQQLGLDVVATVINIIPPAMRRPVWTFKERELNCLHKGSCDYVFGFQGYNFVSEESNYDIKLSVLNSIVNTPNISNSSESRFSNIKDFLRQSHVILDLYVFLKTHFSVIPDNEAAILSLREAVSGNLYVNVVSRKSINSSNYADNQFAKRLIDFLYENQIKYKWCDIPVDGFHKYDGHPNASGYKILRECTRDALSKLETTMR